MRLCPACSEENPDKAKFCLECATSLTEGPTRPRREERKVVTVLFCDLVGSTAFAEGKDPEDVEAALRALPRAAAHRDRALRWRSSSATP